MKYIYFGLYFNGRSITDVLVEKYKWSEDDAQSMASFLMHMLEFYPHMRATAYDCLKHPWIAADIDVTNV